MLGNFRPSTFHLPLSGAARRPGLDRTGGDDRLVTPGVTGPAGTFWSFRAIIISLERAARRRSCGVGATANALGAGPGRGGFASGWRAAHSGRANGKGASGFHAALRARGE